MADERPDATLDVDGPTAPPRENGELIFAAPWESRLFGLTMSLHRTGLFEWDEFRARLIAAIGAWETRTAAGDTDAWSYYQCWQSAFEELLAAKDLCSAPDLQARAEALAARPPGHDH